MSQNRILVVEDDPAVARSLQIALQREGYTILAASTGMEALALARSASPSLVLLDLRLPDLSGFDVCRRLRSEGLRMPILMLTARDEEADKVVGLELGADDYVVKPYSLRELLSRIRAQLRRAYGELADQAGTARLIVGPLELDQDRMQLRRDGQLVELTPIEFRLLRFLATNPDRAFDRESLIAAVWGYEGGIDSQRTVDVHVRHLRQKIEREPSRPELLVTVRGVGYMLARG
jgi:DNA-binding response OmpR family regulator